MMHPRRWYWLLAQVDSAGRPLVVPTDVASTRSRPTRSHRRAGRRRPFLGLPVVLDPNIATNVGAGTNQDRRLPDQGRRPVAVRVDSEG
jgi:hypothetical protein